MQRHAVGIDIGGSFIKGSIVDLDHGRLVGAKLLVPSPAMSTVAAMMDTMARAAPAGSDDLTLGVTFPGVIRGGVVHTAANVAKVWIGQSLSELAAERLNRPVVAINDADAAGLAELHFGAAREVAGTVLVITLGTGIGSAMFVDGRLVPNTELGHLEVDGMEAEARASGRAREACNLTWDAWIAELNLVINRFHSLFWPDLFVICGGITADRPDLIDDLRCPAPIKLGVLRADAGIVGAALATTISIAAPRASI